MTTIGTWSGVKSAGNRVGGSTGAGRTSKVSFAAVEMSEVLPTPASPTTAIFTTRGIASITMMMFVRIYNSADFGRSPCARGRALISPGSLLLLPCVAYQRSISLVRSTAPSSTRLIGRRGSRPVRGVWWLPDPQQGRRWQARMLSATRSHADLTQASLLARAVHIFHVSGVVQQQVLPSPSIARKAVSSSTIWFLSPPALLLSMLAPSGPFPAHLPSPDHTYFAYQ